MTMLTKEQRDALAEKLSSPWGGDVHLLCDGRRITLQVRRESGAAIRYCVMLYIDGYFKGAWHKGDTPEAKFLRKQVKALWSPARRKVMEKAVGKRRFASADFDDYRKTLTHYMPYWSSGKAAIAHLCKVCESVEVAPEPTHQGE